MDALNDILRSFRSEYKKTPVKIKVFVTCLCVQSTGTRSPLNGVIIAGARLLSGVRSLHRAGPGKLLQCIATIRMLAISTNICEPTATCQQPLN